MNEINDLLGEFTDDLLHAQADRGNRLLDEEGFQYRPTRDEMKKLVLGGNSLLFIGENSKEGNRFSRTR
jgi:hypothetical protein